VYSLDALLQHRIFEALLSSVVMPPLVLSTTKDTVLSKEIKGLDMSSAADARTIHFLACQGSCQCNGGNVN
jgi:hypothetical protein